MSAWPDDDLHRIADAEHRATTLRLVATLERS
jgi:hypothetical protein